MVFSHLGLSASLRSNSKWGCPQTEAVHGISPSDRFIVDAAIPIEHSYLIAEE
jgi:hypothetical protein